MTSLLSLCAGIEAVRVAPQFRLIVVLTMMRDVEALTHTHHIRTPIWYSLVEQLYDLDAVKGTYMEGLA